MNQLAVNCFIKEFERGVEVEVMGRLGMLGEIQRLSQKPEGEIPVPIHHHRVEIQSPSQSLAEGIILVTPIESPEVELYPERRGPRQRQEGTLPVHHRKLKLYLEGEVDSQRQCLKERLRHIAPKRQASFK